MRLVTKSTQIRDAFCTTDTTMYEYTGPYTGPYTGLVFALKPYGLWFFVPIF